MAGDKNRVIVSMDMAGGGTQVHHRDFPEIRARGADPDEAAGQLLNQLHRALDTALTDWRREAIQQAVTDVKAFSQP